MLQSNGRWKLSKQEKKGKAEIKMKDNSERRFIGDVAAYLSIKFKNRTFYFRGY